MVLSPVLIPVMVAAACTETEPHPDPKCNTENAVMHTASNINMEAIDIFEGTLHYNLIVNGIQQDFRYRIRQGLIRIEIEDPQMGGSMTLLAVPDSDRMIVLLHEQHAYTELTLREITERSELLIHNLNQLRPTGEMRNIAGIENHEYVITSDDGEVLRLWSPVEASRYGLFQFPEFIDNMLSGMLRSDLPEGLFPFSATYQGKRSNVELSLVKIEEETLDMDLFTVPATYRNIQVTVPDF